MLDQPHSSATQPEQAIPLPDQSKAEASKPEVNEDWLKRADNLGSQIATLFK